MPPALAEQWSAAARAAHSAEAPRLAAEDLAMAEALGASRLESLAMLGAVRTTRWHQTLQKQAQDLLR